MADLLPVRLAVDRTDAEQAAVATLAARPHATEVQFELANAAGPGPGGIVVMILQEHCRRIDTNVQNVEKRSAIVQIL